MLSDRAQAAVVATVVVVALAQLAALNTGSLDQNYPEFSFSCSYQPETDHLRVTVEDGRFVDANTSGLWVVNEGELATISNASGVLLSATQTDSDAWTDSGVWVHDPDIDDVADYPVEPGDSITVGNVTNRTRLVVFWHEQDGGRLMVFWTESDPAPPCRG